MPEIHELMKSQKNEVLEIIKRAGLEPRCKNFFEGDYQ